MIIRCVNCSGPVGESRAVIDGRYYCEKCAREMGLFNDPFSAFEEIAAPLLNLSGLDFANTREACPKCKRTFREIERGDYLGCVECYNKFGSIIRRDLLKRQGTTEYLGRRPQEMAEVEKAEEISPDVIEVNEPSIVSVAEITADTDLGTLTEAELTSQMKKAASEENYKLAIMLRDELNKRKGGN